MDTSPEPFHDLEVCMSLRQPNANQPLLLRVRRALGRDAPFQMRYLGNPEVDLRRPTLVRSCMDCACTNGILEFLTEMGFRLEFEYIAKGWNHEIYYAWVAKMDSDKWTYFRLYVPQGAHEDYRLQAH